MTGRFSNEYDAIFHIRYDKRLSEEVPPPLWSSVHSYTVFKEWWSEFHSFMALWWSQGKARKLLSTAHWPLQFLRVHFLSRVCKTQQMDRRSWNGDWRRGWSRALCADENFTLVSFWALCASQILMNKLLTYCTFWKKPCSLRLKGHSWPWNLLFPRSSCHWTVDTLFWAF